MTNATNIGETVIVSAGAGDSVADQVTNGATDRAANGPAGRPAPKLVEGSGPALSEETNNLLRDRLRISSLLLFVGFLAFLIERIVSLEELGSTLHWISFYGHIAVTILTALVGWRLCMQCRHVLHHLRIVELLVFGGSALFFAIAGYSMLVDGAAHGYVATTAPMWMVLMFTYALFIPNTWQRAAVVIGAMAVTSVGVLVVVCQTSNGLEKLITDRSYVRQGPLDNAMVVILSALIAVWGVHTINSLRREAFEARQMGQYQLRHRIGAGGMGEVYLAEHMMLKRPCVIKIIRPERAGEPGALARFEREVQATAQLTHWNTVEIFDYGHTDDGTFYYVMEYLIGMDLEQLVRTAGSLPPERVVHMLLQVCGALSEAHEQGLIHRDIKPANIYSARLGGVYDVAKLLDFGLAKPMSPDNDAGLTQDRTITGSPQYMSPEQAMGERPDERSDVYSLGAVGWFLATGRPPFEGDNPVRLLVAQVHDMPPRPSEVNSRVPAELDAVIMQCLAKKAEERPQSVADLHKLLAGLSVTGWSDSQAADWWHEQESVSQPERSQEAEPVSTA